MSANHKELTRSEQQAPANVASKCPHVRASTVNVPVGVGNPPPFPPAEPSEVPVRRACAKHTTFIRQPNEKPEVKRPLSTTEVGIRPEEKMMEELDPPRAYRAVEKPPRRYQI